MKKKILLTLTIVFLVFAAGLFYVNKVLLPVQIKGMVVKALEDQLGRKVTLGTLQWGPVKGAAITDLTIYSQEDPTLVFLNIKSASAQILFIPIIHQKVIIPSLKVDSLSVRLVKTGPATWNFSDLLKPSAPDNSKNTPPDIIVSGFAITNTRIKLVDASSKEEFSEMIEPINIKGSLSLAAGLHISGDIAFPATQGTLKFNTRTGLRDKTFKGDFTLTNIIPTRYTRFSPVEIPIKLNAAAVKTAALTVFYQDQTTTISGDAELPGLDITAPGNIHLQSDMAFSKIFLTLKDAGISLEGHITSSKTSLALDPQRTVEGDLRAAISSLTWSANKSSFTGSITGQGMKIRLDADRSLSGAVALNNATLLLANGQINGTADIDLKGLTAQLGKDQLLKGDIALPQLKVAQNADGITATGEIKGNALSLQLPGAQQISCDLDLTKTKLEVKGTAVTLQTDLSARGLKAVLPATTIKGDLTAPATILSLNADTTNITIKPQLRGLEVSLPQGMLFSADASAALQLSVAPQRLDYAGTVDISEGKMTGIPTAGTLSEIHGKLLIETDKLSTKDFSLTALATPILVSGEITNLADPLIAMEASAKNLDLALAEKVVPDIMKQQAIKAAGQADVSLRINAPAKALDPAKIMATAVIRDASVESGTLKQTLKNISGVITYASPSLSWKNLSVDFQDKTYVLNGYLQDFTNPFVATSLKGADLAVDVQVQKSGDSVRIESLTASLFDSSVTASGRINIASGTAPVIDMLADGKITLRDLAKILPPQYAEQIEKLKLAGILKVSGTVKGVATDWPHWEANLSVQTPALYAMGYQIQDLNVSAKEKDGKLDPLEVKGTFYEGELGIISSMGLADKNMPFESTFKLNGTNLELLKRDTPLAQKQLSGTLAVAGNLKGTVADWKNMAGKTTIDISNGYLWDFAILSNILSILSTSFQGGDVVITDASTTLNIAEGRISTNNLTLKSSMVTLLGEGWVDLDQNLDFNVTPTIESQNSGSNSALSLINPTSGLLNIHIGGTVQKPKIEHNLTAPTIIKKTLQNTVGNILKIFE